MKKVIFVSLALLLFCLSITAVIKNMEPGEVRFKAAKNKDRYLVSLRFRQEEPRQFTIKAVKVTCEPSGTVLLALYSKDCPGSERTLFMADKLPLSLTEAPEIKVEMAPSVSIIYPASIKNDNLIKVEYLIERNGKVSIMLAAEKKVDNIESVNFSVLPK
jgi:hypothetical protein